MFDQNKINEPINKDSDSKEPENKEPESKEPESKEPESKESESKELESKELESKELESKELESKEPENKEPESKEPESKEPESKEPESKESIINELKLPTIFVPKDDIIMEFATGKHKNKIALVMMVKNESARIHVSLNSVLGFVSKFIFYDTGSSDNTIDIIVSFCKKYKISCYIKFGQFVDFSTSRNVLLDFADTISNVDFLLMLDCNDELQNGPGLIKFCKNVPKEESGFLIMQRWRASIFIDYFNIRLVRPNNGWRYKGVVHEYISSEGKGANFTVQDVILYQDRIQDDGKSLFRFNKDRELLLSEYNSPEKNARTVYYLAQTCECMNDKENAIKYYTERIYMDGFFEENYQAAYHVAQLMKERNVLFEIYSGYYLKAFELTHRAEPIVRIAEHYISKHTWSQAFVFLKEACGCEIPKCGLFLDIELYKYYRWHLMGIVAYYVKEYRIGLHACEIAVKERHNDIDQYNLTYYKNELNIISDTKKLQLL
jgi:hypothetical protein